MSNNFSLTQEQIDNADKYDHKTHSYIQNYLQKYFESKLLLLKHPNHTVECYIDGMENYTVDDNTIITRMGETCFGDSLGDWNNVLTIHGTARFNCKQEFQIGYNLEFKNKKLITILKELHAISDNKFLHGKKFDEENKLTIISGYMKNNFCSIPTL